MGIDSVLKKEGIQVVSQFDTLKTNEIANYVSTRLCSAFPELNLQKSDLFASICRIKFYIAKMPKDSSKAKYFYKNTSIYFDDLLKMEDIKKLAVHECIHFLQEQKNSKGKLIRLGLSDFTTNPVCSCLNEAAVQLMASEINSDNAEDVTYYNINFTTQSPTYYPLECAIVKQMAYFTGNYSLYYSTLYSDDGFKNTFIQKSDKKTFNQIANAIDKLVDLEDLVYLLNEELRSTDFNDTGRINMIKKSLERKKSEITELFFNIQNTILEKCFYKELDDIKNFEEIYNFKSRLYSIKNILAFNENYTFYNDIYCDLMRKIEIKHEDMRQDSTSSLSNTTTTSLVAVGSKKGIFAYIKKLFARLLEARD